MINVIERIIGRRLLWKVGRKMYYAARREGSLDMTANGETLLQQAFARRSAQTRQALIVADVGANLGEWTTSMVRELDRADAPAAEIVAFEPVPRVREQLVDSLAAVKRHIVTVRDRAVSDAPGKQMIVCRGDDEGIHHLATEFMSLQGVEVEVEVVRLDDEFAGQAIDLVKVDVEGFDPLVVRGCEGLLSRKSIGVIQFEYSVLFMRTRTYLLDMFDIAERHGYKVGLLTSSGIEVFDKWHRDLEQFIASNMVIVRPDLFEWLPASLASYRNDNTRQLTALS